MKKRVWKGKMYAFFIICCLACLLKVDMTKVKAETYEDYYYNLLEDGTISIQGYTGAATNINIPSQIEGKSVTRNRK